MAARAEESVERHGGIDRHAFGTLMRSLTYIDGDYGADGTFSQLREALGPRDRPVHYFRFRVTPAQTIAITTFVKLPGDFLHGESVELTVSEHVDPVEISAYEELLTDAIYGVSARFARQDYVEEAWRIVDPVLDAAIPVFEYEPGLWGPAEANAVAPAGGWFNPVTNG